MTAINKLTAESTAIGSMEMPVFDPVSVQPRKITLAVLRTFIAGDVAALNVISSGAVGNGVADDTAAIMAADAFARLLGARLHFPAGTYMASQLIVRSKSNWFGDGRDATVLRQIPGTNADFIYGLNSAANWGSSSPVGMVNGYVLQGLTINGSWNAGSGNTSGSGVAVFGSRPILRDVFITNCAEHGLRTEYADATEGNDTWGMEGTFENIRIDTVGKHGWLNQGPHDSNTFNVVIVDAGQAATNTWDGMFVGTGGAMRHMGFHAWNRSSTNRHRYAANLQAEGNEFSCSHFEGGYSASLGIFSTKNAFDASCTYYAAWNGVTILLGGTATTNIIQGKLDAAGAGRPNPIGIKLGSSGADFVASNLIDVMALGQLAGTVDFTNSQGANTVRVRGFQVSGVAKVGTPHPTDSVEILMSGITGQDYNTSVAGRLGSFTVAQLNAMTPAAGWVAFASNGRKVGEGVGAGTGVPVYWTASSWRVYSTDAAVAA